MRIALLYPPPFAMPPYGLSGPPPEAAPPGGWKPDQGLGGDEIAMPYGLMSIAAQAKRAGHAVTILNLYAFAWEDVASVIPRLSADLFGLSCLTGNRRGTDAVARLIRTLHPRACIVVGGPHVSALAEETLCNWPSVDAVVVGEGERTFLELADRLDHSLSPAGIEGMAWRANGRPVFGPPRRRIRDLDALASPYGYFSGSILLSARGCPNRCTFCGSPALWGAKVRFHSAEHTLDMLEALVVIHGEKTIAVKDDTFTCSRRRVLKICDGIVRRRLNFLWSCDTRADRLDDELLLAMRRAGCQRISIGVESASPEILGNIRKEVSPEKILTATRMAKKYGFGIRFYMMAGNPGETAETLQTSIGFLYKARPTDFVFSFLSLYPGTEIFAYAAERGMAEKGMFFARDCQVFKAFFKKEKSDALTDRVDWVLAHTRVRNFWRYGVPRREKILSRFPGHPAAHVDLAVAYLEAGDPKRARACLLNALSLDYPLAGWLHNDLAGIAALQNDPRSVWDHLMCARELGLHPTVEKNIALMGSWLEGGSAPPLPGLRLITPAGFQRAVLMKQPADPGPIRLSGPAALPPGAGTILMPRFFS